MPLFRARPPTGWRTRRWAHTTAYSIPLVGLLFVIYALFHGFLLPHSLTSLTAFWHVHSSGSAQPKVMMASSAKSLPVHRQAAQIAQKTVSLQANTQQQQQQPIGTLLQFLSIPDEDVIFFQPVPDHKRGDDFLTFVVSAFIDLRPLTTALDPFIQLVVATQELQGRIHCHVAGHATPIPGVAHVLHGDAAFAFKPAVVTCNLPAAIGSLLMGTLAQGKKTFEVGISADATGAQLKVGAVIIPFLQQGDAGTAAEGVGPDKIKASMRFTDSYGKQSDSELAICTQPLRDDAYAPMLVEWMEYHKNFGSKQAYLYAFNPGPYLSQLLAHYMERKEATVLDWVMHKGMLRDHNERCILPIHVNSTGKAKHADDMVPCSYHQDNYGIRWWGQELAIQDCLYRSMGRYRWVAIMDLDEWIVPRQPDLPNWSALLARLDHPTTIASGYLFSNVAVCSECNNQFTPKGNATQNGIAELAVVEAPKVKAELLMPHAHLTHMVWSGTISSRDWGFASHTKAVVDPWAIALSGVHSPLQVETRYAPWVTSPNIISVPTSVAVKYHVRTHDTHKKTSFSEDLLNGIVAGGVLCTAAGGGKDCPVMQLRKCATSCDVYSEKDALVADYRLANLFGENLTASVQSTLVQMGPELQAWHVLSKRVRGLYGGHEFGAWAPNRTRRSHRRFRMRSARLLL